MYICFSYALKLCTSLLYCSVSLVSLVVTYTFLYNVDVITDRAGFLDFKKCAMKCFVHLASWWKIKDNFSMLFLH